MKLTRKRREIIAAYELLDDGDISTERLLAMVEDQCDCDAGDVIDALLAGNKLTPAKAEHNE